MRWIRAFALAWLYVVLAPAVPMAAEVPESVAIQESLDAEWAARFEAAAGSIRAARAHNTKAQATAAEMKRDNYPRGPARAAILKAADDAERALSEIAAAYPELLERARVAGVFAGVLQRYEDVP